MELLEDIATPMSGLSLYPVLLSFLGIQNYTPKTKTTFRANYDYIIVGAGTAGSVVAGRLSENPSVSVLLLEAGPSPPPITQVPGLSSLFHGSYIDWNVKTTSQKHLKNRVLPYPRGKTVGGSGILNMMINNRGNQDDYNLWNRQGCRGWSYEEVLPYFKRMEEYRVPEQFDDYYHGYNGPYTIERNFRHTRTTRLMFKAAHEMGYKNVDINAESQIGFFQPDNGIRDSQRCATAKAYLIPADQRPNLDIVANAHVERVLFQKFRAIGVKLYFKEEMNVIYANREVIVSAGVIHTPQILMLSGLGPRKHLQSLEIPVVADIPVGQNFHDHVFVVQEYDVLEPIPSIASLLLDPCSIKQYIEEGTGPLTGTYGIIGCPIDKADVSNSQPPVPKNQILFYDRGLMEKGRLTCIPVTVDIKSRGSITLNSTNPFDPPIINPNAFSECNDMKNLIAGLKFCERLMSSDALKSLKPKRRKDGDVGCEIYENDEDAFLACLIKNSGSVSYHGVGTAKMGNRWHPSTVVDPSLRVKGVNCLRVVDASIMPYVTSGNTNTPTIMIAEKASDMIKAYNGCQK